VTGNQLEQDIISLYDDNLVNLFSINQIAHKLGKKYPYINKKVNQLIKQNILNKTVIGKSYLCSLNFENHKTVLMLCMRQYLKTSKEKAAAEVNRFIDEQKMDLSIHCVVSYNNHILFVVEDLRDRRKITRRIKRARVVGKQEFLDLLDEEEAVFRKHAVIYGAERFFELLRIELDELKRLYSPLRY